MLWVFFVVVAIFDSEEVDFMLRVRKTKTKTKAWKEKERLDRRQRRQRCRWSGAGVGRRSRPSPRERHDDDRQWPRVLFHTSGAVTIRSASRILTFARRLCHTKVDRRASRSCGRGGMHAASVSECCGRFRPLSRWGEFVLFSPTKREKRAQVVGLGGTRG